MDDYLPEMPDVAIRPGTVADLRPAYDVFRTSLWDYLQRIGIVPPGTPNDIDGTWERQRAIVEHINRHAAEFWVAEDATGLLGLARSIERDGVFQLTEFFVHPRSQSGGVGKALLDRAFPPGRGRHRSILATLDPRALGLYLRYGVRFQSTTVDFTIQPEPHDYQTDLEFVPLPDLDDPISTVAMLDRRLLDHQRSTDIEFMLSDRPGFLYRRNGEAVGYGFESNGAYAGPLLVTDSADLPAGMSHLENSAAEGELGSIELLVALDAHTAVDWMQMRRHRMVPFFIAMLASDPFIPRDRYIPFAPSLIF